MSDDLLSQLKLNGAIPRHVAVIMDGNGRWARERVTQIGTRLAWNLCISCSSRAELARAARLFAEEVLKGSKCLEYLDVAAIQRHLYTAPWGDPDFLIRTSGERRLSNFLLWQL